MHRYSNYVTHIQFFFSFCRWHDVILCARASRGALPRWMRNKHAPPPLLSKQCNKDVARRPARRFRAINVFFNKNQKFFTCIIEHIAVIHRVAGKETAVRFSACVLRFFSSDNEQWKSPLIPERKKNIDQNNIMRHFTGNGHDCERVLNKENKLYD